PFNWIPVRSVNASGSKSWPSTRNETHKPTGSRKPAVLPTLSVPLTSTARSLFTVRILILETAQARGSRGTRTGKREGMVAMECAPVTVPRNTPRTSDRVWRCTSAHGHRARRGGGAAGAGLPAADPVAGDGVGARRLVGSLRSTCGFARRSPHHED